MLHRRPSTPWQEASVNPQALLFLPCALGTDAPVLLGHPLDQAFPVRLLWSGLPVQTLLRPRLLDHLAPAFSITSHPTLAAVPPHVPKQPWPLCLWASGMCFMLWSCLCPCESGRPLFLLKAGLKLRLFVHTAMPCSVLTVATASHGATGLSSSQPQTSWEGLLLFPA